MIFNWTSSPDSRAEDQDLSGTFPPRVVFKVTRSVEEEENDGQDDHQGHDDEQEHSKTRSTVLSQTYLSGDNDHDRRARSDRLTPLLFAPCAARPLPPRRAAQRIRGWGLDLSPSKRGGRRELRVFSSAACPQPTVILLLSLKMRFS